MICYKFKYIDETAGLPFEVSSIKYIPINNLVTVRTVSDEELKAKRKSICG